MSQLPRQSDSANIESFRRALDCTKKENQDLHNIIKKMQEEKNQLQDKNRQMEAQIKNLQEISSQDQPGEDLQYKPDFQVLNEGWGIMLKQSQQHITSLLNGKKKLQQRLQELEDIAEQKNIMEKLAEDMANMFEKSEEKVEDLQKKLDKAQQINRIMIKAKEQQEAKHSEMARELEDVKAKHQETQQKLQNLEIIHKEMQHRLEDKTSRLEAQTEDPGKISQQDQTGKDLQYNPELQVSNEGSEILLKKSQQHNKDLLVEKEELQQHLQELKGITEGKRQMKATFDEMAGLYVNTEEKHINLQKKLEEALQINSEIIKEKQEQEAKYREMERELEDIKAKHGETQQKLRDVEESYSSKLQELEEKHNQTKYKLKELEERCEATQQKLHKSEEKATGLQVTLDGALQRNAELQATGKAQDQKYKDLKVKYSEKEEEFKELQKRCTKLEEDAQIFNGVKRLILQNKDLEEYRQKMKRKHFFRFFS